MNFLRNRYPPEIANKKYRTSRFFSKTSFSDLIDLLIYEADSSSAGSHLRRASWARNFMTRDDTSHLLSALGLCRLSTITCELRLNLRVWPADDGARRQILNGDYIRLMVNCPADTPASHIQIALCEQEMADVQRYLFRPSPTPSPEQASPADEPHLAESDEVQQLNGQRAATR